MIANLQYGWTLFIDPIDAKYQWGRAPIQIAFTIFIVTETARLARSRSARRVCRCRDQIAGARSRHFFRYVAAG
jgi:hypothetical protein